MVSLVEYFGRKDPVTGETFAAAIDRLGLDLRTIVRTCEWAEMMEQPRGAAQSGRVTVAECFNATAPSGMTWLDYCERNGIGARSALRGCEAVDANRQRQATKTATSSTGPAYWWQRLSEAAPA